MDRHLKQSDNDIEQTGVYHEYQTEEELLHSMGYKQVNIKIWMLLWFFVLYAFYSIGNE